MSVNLTNVYSVESLPQSKYMQNLFKSNYMVPMFCPYPIPMQPSTFSLPMVSQI